MGNEGRRSKGFTLIELLIVVVIISLLAALLLPALMKALCNARQGTASSLISQLAQACKAYEMDYAVYPPGKGQGSKDMVSALSKKGAKQMPYFDFNPDLLDAAPPNANVVNPVWGKDADAPSNLIHYRNNIADKKPGQAGPQAGTMGPGGAPYYKVTSFDMWCAGCDYQGSAPAPTAAYSVRYE